MDQVIHIVEQFTADLFQEGHEDYPNQNAEIRVDHLSKALMSFVTRVASDHTESAEEEAVVVFDLAMTMPARFQSNTRSDLLRARLLARKP